MSATSRSRSTTPSRASTPLLKPSSSRLAVPTAVRAVSSTSNLHVAPAATLYPPSETASAHGLGLDSSASSMKNVDMNEGILIQDSEADVVNSEETTAIGHMDDVADEESRKSLRDHLRRTLSGKRSSSTVSPPRRRDTDPDFTEVAWKDNSHEYAPRSYFVLTEAGKPVFASQPSDEAANSLSSMMGVVQALISIFLDDGDKIRCINAGKMRITFLQRPPLYYVCASSWGEPESATRSHLEYLHLQILSVVTAAQLRRIFERRTNFDLRRLLDGSEPILVSLLHRMELDLAMATSSLHCLQLESTLRARAADALVPITKMKDVLYIILVAEGRVVTLVRPKKHSIHPTDLHILVNTIHAPSIYNSPASASWIPICLPKFNPTGFVNAYISFLRKFDGTAESSRPQSPPDNMDQSQQQGSTNPSASMQPGAHHDTGIVLVCISGGGEFETVRSWCDKVEQKLEQDGTLPAISKLIQMGKTDYSVSALGIPGLRHFVYKSRPHVQVTVPLFEEPYEDLDDRRRIMTLYQMIHDAIHAKSGQEGTLKLQYIRTDKEIVMGWITQPFELYIALSPRLPKVAVINAANAVVRWVKKEETSLFLKDAPVF